MSDIGETGEIFVALFDDDDREDREIGTDDAPSDGFAFTFTGTTRTVAGVTFGKEEANTCWVEDTLKWLRKLRDGRGKYILHGKSLLVVSAGDLENVAFEFVANRVSGDFLTNLCPSQFEKRSKDIRACP